MGIFRLLAKPSTKLTTPSPATASRPIPLLQWLAWLLLCALAAACGQKASTEANRSEAPSTQETAKGPAQPGAATPTEAAPTTPDNLPTALLVSYAQFVVENGAVTSRPGPARLDILRREGGVWVTDTLEDSESRVFHKAMVFVPPGEAPGIVTLGGSAPCDPEASDRNCKAQLKLWRRGEDGWSASVLWESDFGGRFNRMRDAEIGPLLENDKPSIAVGTHDQGVVAIVSAGGVAPQVKELDRKVDTFVHEIELGDLDGNGVLEVYATPSEPNRLREGGEQHGEVVRYDPRTATRGAARTVVADLGNRHAKEILVSDLDGDGTDELYVAVEALTKSEDGEIEIVEPVEIRRYDHGTAPTEGVVIATIPDRFTRFLTAGDLDGDGKQELVAAAFKSGLWLLRPGSNPRSEWSRESIDRDSGGFEHAALAADLNGDGTDELYVAADEQGELRRYVWVENRLERETINRRELPRSRMTWNLAPVSISVVRP